MRVFEQKSDQSVLKQQIPLYGNLKFVNTQLQKQLRRGYESELPKKLSLPEIYDWPLAIVFANGNLMLLWLATKRDFNIWTQAFKEICMPNLLLDTPSLVLEN